MRAGKKLKRGDYNPRRPGEVVITRPKDPQYRSSDARIVSAGEAKRKRAAWAGIPSYWQLAFVKGTFEITGDYGEGLIRAVGADIKVKFWESRLPPGIMSGMVISVVGRLSTINLGQDFQVRDCMLINKRGYRQALAKLMQKYALPPKAFMDLPILFRDKKLTKE